MSGSRYKRKPDVDGLRECSKCRKTKPVDKFWRKRADCDECRDAWRRDYEARGRKPREQIDNFWDKVSPEPNTGCWLWTGTLNVYGYGLFQKERGVARHRAAHRWSYEYYRGAIPEGLELDHLCRTPSCVNPAHLEPVTRMENMRRSKNWIMLQRFKTHCKHGHEFTEENTVRLARGRGCRTCRANQTRKGNAAKRESKMKAQQLSK